ncbi:MAG: M61 family metallopeptidase [Pseudomonadota bacterium]
MIDLSNGDAIVYRIRPEQPESHHFSIELLLDGPIPDGLVLTLPAWIPGSYLIRDFARNIIELDVCTNDGRRVAVSRVDKDRWALAGTSDPVTVRYRVHARDLSVRSAYLDRERGFFNGTALFLGVEGRESRPHLVELLPPANGATDNHWQVATTLPAIDIDDDGYGLYRAADYHALIDYPVTLGCVTRLEFDVAGVPHTIAITGSYLGDPEQLRTDVAAICATHVATFGELPVDRYLFHLHLTANAYGGLEHRDSSSLMAARDALPPPDRPMSAGERDRYTDLLGLFSHEYFHLWHVKRLRPEVLVDPDLTRHAYTRQLWIFEGFTSYYDDRGVLRAGAIDADTYLTQLGRLITRVLRGQGRLRQSVADSSFDAWTRFYQQDANAANAIVSYYAKGALVALALDLRLRRDHGRSLDEVMVRLWERYGPREPGPRDEGIPEGAVEALLSEITRGELDGFLATCVHGTADPPLAELLADFGIAFHTRSRQDQADSGGAPAGESPPLPHVGWVCDTAAGQTRIQAVHEGSPAERAGLSPDDRLVAVAGLRADAGPEAVLRRLTPDTPVSLHFFRDDVLHETTLRPESPPENTVYLQCDAAATADALVLRRDWLGC